MRHDIRMDQLTRTLGDAVYTGRHGDSRSRFDRDVSGRCERPVSLDLTGRDDRNKDRPAAFLDLTVPCRSCGPCRRQRARLWRERAFNELRYVRELEQRSWFVTLTLRPSSHHLMQLRAIQSFNDRGRDPTHHSWEGLDEADRQRTVERQSAFEVVKYLKRVRKETLCVFRYLCVTEAHQSGDPHYHILFHERSGGMLRERVLRKQWHLGFAHALVVRDTENVASYATKVARYISKSPAGLRVRASLGYGDPLCFGGLGVSPPLAAPSAPLFGPRSSCVEDHGKRGSPPSVGKGEYAPLSPLPCRRGDTDADPQPQEGQV